MTNALAARLNMLDSSTLATLLVRRTEMDGDFQL